MRSLIVATAVALAFSSLAAAPVRAFAPAPAGVKTAPTAVPAAYYHRRHYYHGRVPRYLRGFEDPGYAYHGNINGCAVDLGYGRWESCDVGR